MLNKVDGEITHQGDNIDIDTRRTHGGEWYCSGNEGSLTEGTATEKALFLFFYGTHFQINCLSVFLFVCLFLVGLGFELRVSCLQSRSSMLEPHLQPLLSFFIVKFNLKMITMKQFLTSISIWHSLGCEGTYAFPISSWVNCQVFWSRVSDIYLMIVC
jgi:hypothetical protein